MTFRTDNSQTARSFHFRTQLKAVYYSHLDVYKRQREPYTVVIPPPNVTGELHMGHMLNNTIQDLLVRRARMEGKNACWVPGTDHASIATEAKVVKDVYKRQTLNGDAFIDINFLKDFKFTFNAGTSIRDSLSLIHICDLCHHGYFN